MNVENVQDIKDSTLIDDQITSEFDVRKNEAKKGKEFFYVSQNPISMTRTNILTSYNSNTDEGSYCELCELFLPIPVTYHMRAFHHGCGRRANGKGYNSGK